MRSERRLGGAVEAQSSSRAVRERRLSGAQATPKRRSRTSEARATNRRRPNAGREREELGRHSTLVSTRGLKDERKRPAKDKIGGLLAPDLSANFRAEVRTTPCSMHPLIDLLTTKPRTRVPAPEFLAKGHMKELATVRSGWGPLWCSFRGRRSKCWDNGGRGERALGTHRGRTFGRPGRKLVIRQGPTPCTTQYGPL